MTRNINRNLTFPVTSFIRKTACTLVVLVLVEFLTGAALSGEVSSIPSVILEKIRAWHHKDYSSIVFQFESSILFEKPIVQGSEVFTRLKNVTTKLASFREYKTLDSWVLLKNAGNDLNVRIGLPEGFRKLSYYLLSNPYRLAIKLYKERKPFPSLPEKVSSGGRDASTASVAEASRLPEGVAEKVAESLLGKPAEPDKTVLPPGPEAIEESRGIVDHLSGEGLITVNFYQVDIQEPLSALAMNREINIVMGQDVSGKVSVHLFQATVDEALDAITLAGGFSYLKRDKLYYIYKPKEAKDPQAERLQMRVFKLQYAEIEKVQEVLDAIPNKRLIQIHEDSKCVIVEDIPENIKKVETILSFLDTPPRQVMIEAKILEVSLTDEMSLGVNWEKILGDVRIGTGGLSTATMPPVVQEMEVGGTGGPTTMPYTGRLSPVTGTGIFGNIITGAGSRHQFMAALDALQTKTRINILSTPKILAIHGKVARVQVGGEQGYKTTTTNMGVTTEKVEFIDTGTILEITPYIDDEGNVLLNVKPDIKSAKIEGGVPVVMTTGVSTWLLAKAGETVFIAGLIKDEGTKTREMVPCIGNIPMLGWFFRHTSQKTGKSELVVLITPYVVKTELERFNQEAIEKTKEVEEELNRES